jgi:hypothetical protein
LSSPVGVCKHVTALWTAAKALQQGLLAEPTDFTRRMKRFTKLVIGAPGSGGNPLFLELVYSWEQLLTGMARSVEDYKSEFKSAKFNTEGNSSSCLLSSKALVNRKLQQLCP